MCPLAIFNERENIEEFCLNSFENEDANCISGIISELDIHHVVILEKAISDGVSDDVCDIRCSSIS